MIVPYEIDPIIDSIPKYKAALISAFYDLESFTCLRFRLRTREENFLSFVDFGGCWSYVGKVGGKQMVSLGKGCKTKGKATHEILHAIGFVHEHQRSGRDEFIKVKIENIDKRCGIDGLSSCQPNFKTINPDFLNYKGVFDQQSVMHYDGYSFAKSPKLRHPTILNIKTDSPVQSQRLQASIFDLEKICDMYNCSVDKLLSCHSSDLSKTDSSRKCNGITDCFDHADELNCDVCKRNAIKCFTMNQCILRSHVCDGHIHCVDGSDELHCYQNCSQEYRLNVQDQQYQFQQIDEYVYELSSTSFAHLSLRIIQTDLYWIIQDANNNLVAFSFKQNKIDCPQHNLWYFKTVSSWHKTELISMAKPVFGYVGPADWIESISITDDESTILHQPISNMSNKVQSLLVLLKLIPLDHNGCKVYVKAHIALSEKHRVEIMRVLKQTQCLLVTLIASFLTRHKRDLNFDDFELIADDSHEVFYETSNHFYEAEEAEYEYLQMNGMDNGYFTTTRISISICNGMHRHHLSGTYDITSGEFLMHQEEACIESLDCWDSDLSLCFCEIGSNQPSCFFEMPDVPNLPLSDIFSRKFHKSKISKKNKRDKKRKNEKTLKTAAILSTTFPTTISTTVKSLSSIRVQKTPFIQKNVNLNCYKCTSKGCDETIKCSLNQICFTEVRKRGNTITQLQGGCKETRECYTQAKQSKKWCKSNSDIGSSTGSTTGNWSWCYNCCSKNHCNKKYFN